MYCGRQHSSRRVPASRPLAAREWVECELVASLPRQWFRQRVDRHEYGRSQQQQQHRQHERSSPRFAPHARNARLRWRHPCRGKGIHSLLGSRVCPPLLGKHRPAVRRTRFAMVLPCARFRFEWRHSRCRASPPVILVYSFHMRNTSGKYDRL